MFNIQRPRLLNTDCYLPGATNHCFLLSLGVQFKVMNLPHAFIHGNRSIGCMSVCMEYHLMNEHYCKFTFEKQKEIFSKLLLFIKALRADRKSLFKSYYFIFIGIIYQKCIFLQNKHICLIFDVLKSVKFKKNYTGDVETKARLWPKTN